MTRMTLDLHREDEAGPYTLHVDVLWTPGDPGQYSGPPERCYEGTPGLLDVTQVQREDANGRRIVHPGTLSESDRDELHDQATDAWPAALEATREDADEARTDARRETDAH